MSGKEKGFERMRGYAIPAVTEKSDDTSSLPFWYSDAIGRIFC
jgi:hypothetical protein